MFVTKHVRMCVSGCVNVTDNVNVDVSMYVNMYVHACEYIRMNRNMCVYL